MLIIGRRQQESIIIDGRIEIVISGIVGDKVQLAIDAPADVVILRKELYETSCLNQQASSMASQKDVKGFAEALKEKQFMKEKKIPRP